MKNILIVTGSDYTDQVYTAFKKVKNLWNKLYLLSDWSFEPKGWYFEKHFKYDLRNTMDALLYMKSQDIQFNAIAIKTSEWLTPLVALLCKQYWCIWNDPIVAFNCRSKYHMRKKMKEWWLPIPEFKLCKSYEEILSWIKEIWIPCVLKPVGWNASYWTFMIKSESDLDTLKAKYDLSIKYLKEKSISEDIFWFTKEEMDLIWVDVHVDMVSDYLVEEYIDWEFQISVDAITQDWKTTIFWMAEQIRTKPPYFVQLSETMPFEADKSTTDEINVLAKRTISVLWIENSASHTEIIWTKDWLKVVETACRIWWDNIHDSVYQTTWFNLMFESIMVAIWEKRKFKVSNRCHVAMQYILPNKKWTISNINLPGNIEEKYNVTEIQIDCKKWDKVDIPPTSYDFIWYVCTKWENSEIAQVLLNRAIRDINIEIN